MHILLVLLMLGQPAACEVTVTAATLRVRSGPRETYTTIGAVSAGQSLELLGRSTDSAWGRVAFLDEIGWLSLDPAFTELTCEVDELPAIGDVPPPPEGERARITTPTAQPEPSPTPSPEPTATEVAAPLTVEAPTPTETAAAPLPATPTPEPTTPSPISFVLGGIALVILVIVGAVVLLRRSQSISKAPPEERPLPAKAAVDAPPEAKTAPVPPPDLPEVPANATTADLITVPEGETLGNPPKLKEDLQMLIRHYLKARTSSDHYAPLKVMAAADDPIPPWQMLDVALRVRRAFPDMVQIGRTEAGALAVRIKESFVRSSYYAEY